MTGNEGLRMGKNMVGKGSMDAYKLGGLPHKDSGAIEMTQIGHPEIRKRRDEGNTEEKQNLHPFNRKC